jgi:hypothetical protein
MPQVDLDHLAYRLNSRLDGYLATMKPNHDDSIVGFNEAWDIVRDVLEQERKSKEHRS